MNRDQVGRWLDSYIAAWRSNDRDRIAALFTEDAEYRYRPYQEPVIGASAIAADWLRDPDEPGAWEADYAPLAVDGDIAVATGETRYPAEGKVYSNIFVMRFAGDRCSSFTEWYMRQQT